MAAGCESAICWHALLLISNRVHLLAHALSGLSHSLFCWASFWHFMPFFLTLRCLCIIATALLHIPKKSQIILTIFKNITFLKKLFLGTYLILTHNSYKSFCQHINLFFQHEGATLSFYTGMTFPGTFWNLLIFTIGSPKCTEAHSLVLALISPFSSHFLHPAHPLRGCRSTLTFSPVLIMPMVG